ncbi:hypothetical protein KCM76_22910 [Zooshikella marina]|uniref:hypothetical protein n=1 Tax=Zooshikella ganghwensis TaxID=202772 RepID=UPI001BB00144|nr:hypothetical protein [Zooshikella ganghwensis]MBU2708863.1 hypothetical protein [Zooshikella ganghwensis]
MVVKPHTIKTQAQLHLEMQRNGLTVLSRLIDQSQLAETGTYAILPEPFISWPEYLASTSSFSEKELKKLLEALEDKGYIQGLAGFIGNIKLLEKATKVKNRVNLGGGYCGFDKDNPHFELARPINKTKRYPSVIIKAIERFADYYKRPNLFPSLAYCQPHKKKPTKKGKTSRHQYAQRRYACAVVMAAMLKRMDIKTRRLVVTDEKGNIYDCKVSVLVNDTGLPRRRVERALSDMEDGALLDVLGHPTEKDEQGKFVACPAMRAINESLFGVLGLASALKYEQEKREKKQIKKQKKQKKKETDNKVNRSGQFRVKLAMKAAAKRSGKEQVQPKPKPQKHHDPEAAKKMYLAKVVELYQVHKGKKTSAEIYKLARELTGYNGD